MVHFVSFVILRTDRTERPPMLVMECNIDGPATTFFQMLAESRDPDVDHIFECCEEYRKGCHDAKVRFFKDGRKKPQLYHVGAPWRSVASIKDDHAVRRTLERGLRETTSDSLMTDIVVPPVGHHEYWLWEMFEPWAAWLLAFGGTAFAYWLSTMTKDSPLHLPGRAVLALTAFYVALAL